MNTGHFECLSGIGMNLTSNEISAAASAATPPGFAVH